MQKDKLPLATKMGYNVRFMPICVMRTRIAILKTQGKSKCGGFRYFHCSGYVNNLWWGKQPLGRQHCFFCIHINPYADSVKIKRRRRPKCTQSSGEIADPHNAVCFLPQSIIFRYLVNRYRFVIFRTTLRRRYLVPTEHKIS